ncbi:MAG: IS1 family transposase [Woronichinia naegeliana WA131]|uniref:IS1 family transposase n=1 Tax=Woronichinia naegeliana WA131 TaxID=2824559 RepID=A0A977KWM2_9CYAN|nr:MAG: IS1 family transposase [Woronichinia naegeliana WA131]
MSILKKSSMKILNDVGLCQEKEDALFKKNCPHCYSENVKIHSHYQTKGNGERKMFICQECSSCFAETYGSVIAGVETPLSEIVKVLKARMEGIGLNAAARAFGYAKTTILNWEKKLSGLQETLFLYALVNEFVKLVIEGDELYTKVGKNKEASASEGWTIVLMDRASRFIWHLKCGKKEQKLFLEAMMTVAELFERSAESLQLFTDGEKRYSQLLFNICHEVLRTGKRGRPTKVLPKGLVVRLKNKSSKRRDSEGKLKKVETPKPEHPETTEKPEEKDVHANHVEAFNSAIRRYLAAFCRRTNTYAKSVVGLQRVLDIFWMVHNFVRSHFTTREVPAVALGIIEKGLTWEDLLQIRLIS